MTGHAPPPGGADAAGPRRLAVLAQWAAEPGLPAHVRIHLERLRPLCARLVLVSNSPLGAEGRREACRLCDCVLERRNSGYDFAAWRDALSNAAPQDWDEVVLTNSSVIGPLRPLGEVFETMAARDLDLWGMTRSHKIRRHLQSYFLVFRKAALTSPAWLRFWSGIDETIGKKQLIRRSEIGLSAAFEADGLRLGAFTQDLGRRLPAVFLSPVGSGRLPLWRAVRGATADPTIFQPTEIVALGMPYLKASLVWTHHRRVGVPLERIKAMPGVAYPWAEIGL